MIGTLVLAILMALATWVAGWFAVPLLAAAMAGVSVLTASRWSACTPRNGAVAAAFAWLGLLGIDALGGRLPALAGPLGGIFHLPGALLLAIVPIYAALMAWSAGTIAEWLALRFSRR